MAIDKNKKSLKVGDRVKLEGEVVVAHPELVTVQLLVPAGQYAAPVTFHPGCTELLAGQDPLGPDSKEETNGGSKPDSQDA